MMRPTNSCPSHWDGPKSALAKEVEAKVANTLRAFGDQADLVEQQAEIERDTASGGYARRQIYELVQNSADAIRGGRGGRIHIRLTGTHLYCADDGAPITLEGVKALMFSKMSTKRAIDEIGRFGLGFKSVLRVTDSPDFISRSLSLSFDKSQAAERLRQCLGEGRRHYPIFPFPGLFDPTTDRDALLREMMKWATNIVRLPLKPDSHGNLRQQIEEFPPEFLLFVDHVRHLDFETDDLCKEFGLRKEKDGVLHLFNRNEEAQPDPNAPTRWRCFNRVHTLTADARADAPGRDDHGGKVPIWWAAPIDGRRQGVGRVLGKYWAYFPTATPSLLGGILNAPWSTNSDRQNLLDNKYNNELVDVAADLVAESLLKMSTPADLGLHLDLLPRRKESGDHEYSNRLRDRLSRRLPGTPIVPDQDGQLRRLAEVRYPPDLGRATRNALDLWEQCSWRPRNWAHSRSLARARPAKIDRLRSGDLAAVRSLQPTERESVACWLEALVAGRTGDDAVEASKIAIRIAAQVENARVPHSGLGRIVWTQSGEWKEPDSTEVFFVSETTMCTAEYSSIVHRNIAGDPSASAALRSLGISPMSWAGLFEAKAKTMLDGDGIERPSPEDWDDFWRLSRLVEMNDALEILNKCRDAPRVRVVRGTWQRLHHTLLPGAVVPGDGTRDNDIAIDMEYHHQQDKLLLAELASEGPRRYVDLQDSDLYGDFLSDKKTEYVRRVRGNPHERLLVFANTHGSGPLDILKHLSRQGKAHYTAGLLSTESTYNKWSMRHQTRPRVYPPIEFESLTIHAIREHGMIACDGDFATLRDLRMFPQKYESALRKLMTHRKAEQIRQAFDLEYPKPEAVGGKEVGALVEVWPELRKHLKHLSDALVKTRLVRCQGFRGRRFDRPVECVHAAPNLYVVGDGDDLRQEVRLVSQELKLELSDQEIEAVVRYNVDRDRSLVREGKSDVDRLLAAVGAEGLRSRLWRSLLVAIQPLTDDKIAEAAIASYHAGALKEYRSYLFRLDPPARWAGSREALEFVRSLGFSDEWAGQRGHRREPFQEVNAPHSLPRLHGYQEKIVANIHEMLLKKPAGEAKADRRGMVTLPTGAGKTRAVVEAIVTAMDKGLKGSVLWVADRDELCEQAVQAWCQVWSGVGPAGQELRVSRMWGGQPMAEPGRGRNVVVATPQTLRNKVAVAREQFDFSVVVFDEAHRSTPPMATSVKKELGVTRWKRPDEPFLLGLTATPYRGLSVSESGRLAVRYGQNRLDSGAFPTKEPEEIVRHLQKDGILAKADHETVEGTGDFALTAAEKKELGNIEHHAWLPPTAERRIADDKRRNTRIVDAYLQHVAYRKRAWPTLVFAMSVEHSDTIAALFELKGIRARSVSGETETSSRRQAVEKFRSGELDMLVNYRVFAEGFDAPNTRVIMVARPVFSPNLYFQMIGRGLRGPKNGGNERCLIINVEDNIKGFGRKLAFSELDWLWD